MSALWVLPVKREVHFELKRHPSSDKLEGVSSKEKLKKELKKGEDEEVFQDATALE